jgi:hypothetical protein
MRSLKACSSIFICNSTTKPQPGERPPDMICCRYCNQLFCLRSLGRPVDNALFTARCIIEFMP